jgi:hypothetical protein
MSDRRRSLDAKGRGGGRRRRDDGAPRSPALVVPALLSILAAGCEETYRCQVLCENDAGTQVGNGQVVTIQATSLNQATQKCSVNVTALQACSAVSAPITQCGCTSPAAQAEAEAPRRAIACLGPP